MGFYAGRTDRRSGKVNIAQADDVQGAAEVCGGVRVTALQPSHVQSWMPYLLMSTAFAAAGGEEEAE